MAAPTYKSEVVVLRKTKLGEGDLILTCLDTEGAQLRFVAKGARKPASSFSSRLELFAHANVLLVKGKSLDICKEAKLVEGYAQVRGDIERSAGASAVCELLSKTTEQGLGNAKLFPLTERVLKALQECAPEQVASVTAAALLKVLAFQGFRPELRACVICGNEVNAEGGRPVVNSAGSRTVALQRDTCNGIMVEDESPVASGNPLYGRAAQHSGHTQDVPSWRDPCFCAPGIKSEASQSWTAFSSQEGGVVCANCRSRVEYVRIDTPVIDCACKLLFATFDEIERFANVDPLATTGVLRLCQQWSRVQVGVNVKSIDFLLTSALV